PGRPGRQAGARSRAAGALPGRLPAPGLPSDQERLHHQARPAATEGPGGRGALRARPGLAGRHALRLSVLTTSGQLRIGQPVRRLEDDAFLTGAARYNDDLDLPGAVHAAFVRSPHVYARVLSIDAGEALGATGVLGVYTANDLRADGLGPMQVVVAQRGRDGSAARGTSRPVLAEGCARFVGEAVAIVLARSQREARDAAERVAVAYEALPHATDARGALAPGAPPVHGDARGNLALEWEGGDRQATESAFARAAHVTRVELVVNRVSAAPIEPRGAAAVYDAASGRFALHVPTQGSKAIQVDIAS